MDIWKFTIKKKSVVVKRFTRLQGSKESDLFAVFQCEELTVVSQVPLYGASGNCKGYCHETGTVSLSTLISKKSLEPKQTGKNFSPGQVTEVPAAETRNKVFFYLENNYSGQELGLGNHTEYTHGEVGREERLTLIS